MSAGVDSDRSLLTSLRLRYIFEICKAYDVPFSSELLPETKVATEEAEAGEEQDTVAGPTDDQKKEDGSKTEKQEKDAKPADKTDLDSKPASTTAAKSDKDTKAPSTAASTKKTEKDEYDSLEARFAALKRR